MVWSFGSDGMGRVKVAWQFQRIRLPGSTGCDGVRPSGGVARRARHCTNSCWWMGGMLSS